MATMSGQAGDKELIWTDGVWSGDERAVRMATAESTSGDTMEFIPFGEFPLDDDSSEVVGWIINWVLGGQTGLPVTLTSSEGMKSRTAALGEYDGSGRVY